MRLTTAVVLLPFAVAKPQLGDKGKGSPTTPRDPNIDYPTMMCLNHPADGSNAAGKETEAIWGSPNGPGPDEKCIKDLSGGSGPYKANMTTEPSLATHTIYAPIFPPPATEQMPLIIWNNGRCLAEGMMFFNFLNEMASQGFFVIANGSPKGSDAQKQTTYRDGLKGLDWATKNPDILKKYGNVDMTRVISAGQSCGGLEAYQQTLNDPRIKMTLILNSGNLGGSAAMMPKFKTPIAYFLGGPKDVAERNGEADFKALPSTVPSILASIDVGHMGTYYQKHGGKIGKAVTKFLRWQYKGETPSKALFCSPAGDSELVKVGWKIQTKGPIC